MDWLVPWYSVTDNARQVAAMEHELCRELAVGHPLYGLPVRTVGRRQDCDDVLFAIDDGTGRFAVVHLTWLHNPPDRPPWPCTAVYLSFDEWVAECMHRDHKDFHEEQPV